MELAITADVGRHLGKQPEALTKQCVSRLATEMWGGKIGNDEKERRRHRRLEIMAAAGVSRQPRAISNRDAKVVFCSFLSILLLWRGAKRKGILKHSEQNLSSKGAGVIGLFLATNAFAELEFHMIVPMFVVQWYLHSPQRTAPKVPWNWRFGD